MVGTQGAAVGRYDIEANRQPEAGAAAGAVARSFRPVKAFAQAGQLLIADAGGAVGEVNHQHPAAAAGGDVQAAAAVGIAQAVLQQIVEELHQAVAVAEDHRLLRERHLNA
ncbi:Uncharacterised protein [Klebsiella pneumoniae subsp. ozaenae]|uniref:Uncharacterized protein n=1 Tax=Klebsiella pneumoniae subsp. ozaenae TaxID=574 RepID=A0A378A0I3_KLEPO|nr:Uncharacterised protein [Klebsiella pneumoniae subsp. ozaenae]